MLVVLRLIVTADECGGLATLARMGGKAGRLTLFALALAIAAPVGAQAAETVASSGPLTARVDADPWHLDFAGPGGELVLGEAAGTGPSPTGTLGFRTNAGTWFHATRVIVSGRDGPAYTATLATTDPLGRTLAVRIEPDAEGVIRLESRVEGLLLGEVNGSGIAFGAAPGERYLGFGERSNAVDQRGNTVEHYVAEGPYQREERPVIAAFVPPPGFRPRDDATYFPIPWLLSTRGYGVLVDNDEESRHRLGSDDPGAWSVEVDAPTLRMRIFAGPKPADAVRRFSASVGRQPPAAASFYFGPWYQPRRGVDPFVELKQLKDADTPLSLAQTYTHYLPCADQRGREEAERERVRRFHEAGLAITTYFNPMICTSYQPVYDEAKARGALTKDRQGNAYEYRYTGSEPFFVGQFDFTTDAGMNIMGRLLGEAIADGHDGWMEDFGEYTPLDSVNSKGETGTAAHNDYVEDYHCGFYDLTRNRGKPFARFNRSGWTGSARCSQIVWNGDPTVSFGFDGLESAVKNGLTMGLSGVSTWGSDIGGFFALGNNPGLSPELLIRWLEFGAVSGVMRTQANGFHIPASPRAQISDPAVLRHWRRYAKLRTQLYPYIAAAEGEYQRNGLPIMRHLSLAYPDDERAVASEGEFMFGPDLLAAPVVADGQRSRQLYLPEGKWVSFWGGVSFQPKEGGFAVRSTRVRDGGGDVTLRASLGELPMLVRAGAVLPMLPADVDTLADYGAGAPGNVRLADRRNQLRLLAFPRGQSSTPLADGGQLESTEGRDRWTLSVNGKRRTAYSLEASMSTLERRLRPCRVLLNGRPLKRTAWRYDKRRRALSVRFKLRSGRVTALGSCGRR